LNHLVPITNSKPSLYFSGDNLMPLLKGITAQVMALEPDTTTGKGRKEIASLANKVSRSKTYLDGLGKELVAGWKQQAQVVDKSRKQMRDYLDDLRDMARKPLSDWECKEADRVSEHQKELRAIEDMGSVFIEATSAWLISRIDALRAVEMGPRWEEFEPAAKKAKTVSLQALDNHLQTTRKSEAEQAELKRLREEAAQREHTELVLKRQNQDLLDQKMKAIRDKEQAEMESRRAHEAENRAKHTALRAVQQERDRVEREAKEKEAKLQRDKEFKERALVHQKKQAEYVAAKTAEAETHKSSIKNTIKRAFVSRGLENKVATALVNMIDLNQIPHLKIEY